MIDKPRAAEGTFASWGHRSIAQVDYEWRRLAIHLRRLSMTGRSYEGLADSYGLEESVVERLVTKGWY